MSFETYPIKFQPILKSKIWGGQKLKDVLNKPTQYTDIGESWEISGVEGDVSVISNGIFKDKTLSDLLYAHGNDVLGERLFAVFGTKFPLLIKFIDAKEDLSIQLHPNDELAAERHNSFGKTEMWYVMQADPGAKLIVGFNQEVEAEGYLKHLEEKKLTELLNFELVEAGDTFFIEVGRIHAIGAGVMLAEIQQTSDITYRIYDWDRVDDQGNSRELHNDLAIDAIDFDMPDDYKVNYQTLENTSNSMVSCPYFKTSIIPLKGSLEKPNTFDSFIIYVCVEGEATISADGVSETMKTGETVLVPAQAHQISLQSDGARLLEVSV
jgi:mannose-6-phosphate isomerase